MKQIINSYITPEWPNVEVEFNKPIELFIDGFMNYNPNKNTFKILWVKEAEEISKFKNIAIENHKKFDIVLSYDEEILQKCNNSHFMPFGTTWIKEFNINQPKKFQISHLTGHKEMTPLHLLRKKVYYKQTQIKNPIDFYISKYGGVENVFNNKCLNDCKNPLFESQFHITIENSKQKNYFTEKLIDCFVTKTIPIYCGCENIQDFFDIRGMFIVNNFKEIIEICNSIDKDTYDKMREYIEINFQKAQEYANIREKFKTTMINILKEKKVSIIIPTYEARGNGVRFLTELFETIKKQTYKNIETIVSDHSKNEDIKKLCEKQNFNITHFFNKRGTGNSSINMNEGIKKSTGEIIKIMHMDDVFFDNKAIEKMVIKINQNPNFKWGAFGFNHNYEKENLIRREMQATNYFQGEIGKSAMVGCPSVSFFINDNNFFDENLIIVNDFDMHYRLQKKYGNPLIINDVCITIRIHDEQVTTTLETYNTKERQEMEYLKIKLYE